MSIIIETKEVVKCGGFRLWAVFVNGKQVGKRTYASEALAIEKKRNYLHAWNVERIYEKGKS